MSRRYSYPGVSQIQVPGAQVSVEMNVSLSFTWVGAGTLANVRGLWLIKILLIYTIIE